MKHDIYSARYRHAIAPKCLSALAKERPAWFLDRPEPENRGWLEDYLARAEYLSSCVIEETLVLLNPGIRLEQSCWGKFNFGVHF